MFNELKSLKSFIFKGLRLTFFPFLLLINGTGLESCGKKVYPSGLEGDLGENQRQFARNERRRKRIAKRHDRKTMRLEAKANRPKERIKREEKKNQELQIKRHIAKQTPDVQERMKRNMEYTKKNIAPNKSKFWKKLLFWKKNKRPYGSR